MTPDSSSSDEIRRFEEQYKRQPDSLVFARLADAHRKAGQPEKALSILEDGLTRHPDYPSGHIVHARTLRDLGRVEETLDSFRRALELDASNLVAIRELAGLAEERGDTQEAHHWYERLVQIEPANVEYRHKLTLLEAIDAPGEGVPGPELRLDEPAGSSEWWDDSAVTLEPEAASWVLPDGGGFDAENQLDAESQVETDEPAGVDEPLASDEPVSMDETGAAEDPLADIPVLEIPQPPGLETPLDVEIPDEKRPEEEAVEAILNGDVPNTVRAEDTWWYEEAPTTGDPEPEPSRDADLLTRTMADLYAEQGLHSEAAEIYRELLEAAPDDPDLLERLESATEKSRASTGLDDGELALDSDAQSGPADIAPVPEMEPPAGTPIVDELRQLLRMGEERAGDLPDPERVVADARMESGSEPESEAGEDPEPEPAPEQAPSGEDESQSMGEFAREWLRGLEGGA